MHNYFLFEHNYSQSVIYSLKYGLKLYLYKIIIARIVISGIIINFYKFLKKNL